MIFWGFAGICVFALGYSFGYDAGRAAKPRPRPVLVDTETGVPILEWRR